MLAPGKGNEGLADLPHPRSPGSRARGGWQPLPPKHGTHSAPSLLQRQHLLQPAVRSPGEPLPLPLSQDKSRGYFAFVLSISSTTCQHAACLMGIQVRSRSPETAGSASSPCRGKLRLGKSAAPLRAKCCWIPLNFWKREGEGTEQRKITKKTDEEENADQKKI